MCFRQAFLQRQGIDRDGSGFYPKFIGVRSDEIACWGPSQYHQHLPQTMSSLVRAALGPQQIRHDLTRHTAPWLHRQERDQRLGLSVVASLLERDDDDQLWDEIMAGHAQLAADTSIVL